MTGSIGQRVARYRRRAGFSSTQALAEHIGNPRVTDSVLRNIETGRKADVTVTQLLEIALGLSVPVSFLLTEVERPLELVDLPNVSPRLAELTAGELDARISGSGPDASWWPPSHAAGWRHLHALRRVLQALAMLEAAGDDDDDPTTAFLSQGDARPRVDRRQLQHLVDVETRTLAEYQDVSWVPRPWRAAEA